MKLNLGEFLLQSSQCGRLEARQFIGGRHFRVHLQKISDAIMRPLTSRMIDLLRIAASAYFIDRLVARDRKHGPQGWGRTISYSLEVLEPEFWSASPLREILHETLCFVSGDRWHLEFRQMDRQGLHGSEYQRSIDPNHLGETRRVCLYSAGLDSAAGLAKQMIESPQPLTLAVTVQHRTDLGGVAKAQLQQLQTFTKADLIPIIIPFEMDCPKSLVKTEERSQRTRSFLFVTAGGIVAAAAGSKVLEMYESGVGAINAPLLAGMEGSQATRSAHPNFLKLMSRLLEHVVGHSFEVYLPFLSLTKGDVVKSLAEVGLQELAKSTISCAHYPVRVEKGCKWKSCGLCPACIFRRIVLHAAGIEEATDVYQYDLFDAHVAQLPPKTLRVLTAYLLQVDSLRELDAGNLPTIIARHLRQTNLLQVGESHERYIDLFRRYRSEWYSLLEQARRKGGVLANRIDVPRQAS